MEQETYDLLKESYIEFINNLIKDFGGMSPSITVLGTNKKDQMPAVLHIPIPGFLMDTENNKDQFIEEVVPKMADKIKEDFDILAVAWASEAWLRKVDRKDGSTEVPDDWKSLPKKEVLVIMIESENKNDSILMEIVRKGQQINSEGQLTDDIDLVPMPDFNEAPEQVEGRFTGLYKRFTSQ